jgi:hypothetical protein
MKQTLTSYDFVNLFLQRCPNSFSRAALFALFDYYGEIDREAEDEIEFDPVSIAATGPSTSQQARQQRPTGGKQER